MSIFVVWLDQEHARIFQFSNEKMERTQLRARHTDHHTHRPDSLDHQNHERAFFALLSTHLESAGQLLILGPGLAKNHFQKFLIENIPTLAKAVVGCEDSDHPSDGQIASLARKFFRLEVPAPRAC